MPWVYPPMPEYEGVTLTFDYVKIQQPGGPPVNAMTFPQLVAFFQSLHGQVEFDTPVIPLLERCIDAFRSENN